MEFYRTPSGLSAEHLFHEKIRVYVEGKTDIPFYEAILHKYNCQIVAKNGKLKCKALATVLEDDDRPYLVVLDGDYEILRHRRSKHRRVILLHRYASENYLLEEAPVKKFCRHCTSLDDTSKEALTSEEFTDFIEEVETQFKDLLILDVVRQRLKIGESSFFKKPDRFYREDFIEDQIQKVRKAAKKKLQEKAAEKLQERIVEAKDWVEQYLKDHRFIDILPGHFALELVRRLVYNTVNRNVTTAETQLYLSITVWRLVDTDDHRDHRSLKRRLQRGAREAERIREEGRRQ